MLNYFDKLEDRVRHWISKRPVLFGFVGGFAIVEFWRGVWQLTDFFSEMWGFYYDGFWSNLVSLVVSSIILLMTGLYVSLFIGDSVIISGLKKEKKDFEKTNEELKKEDLELDEINGKMDRLSNTLKEIKDELAKLKKE
jgi:uncharacterized membrane protein (DUF106 family)